MTTRERIDEAAAEFGRGSAEASAFECALVGIAYDVASSLAVIADELTALRALNEQSLVEGLRLAGNLRERLR